MAVHHVSVGSELNLSPGFFQHTLSEESTVVLCAGLWPMAAVFASRVAYEPS